MNCRIKSIIAAAAFAVLAGGCATYDYGYSQPYAYGYGYDYGPYYGPSYYYGPGYYYSPGYYVGPPSVGFFYYDSSGHRHYTHDQHWNGGHWNGDRGHVGRVERGNDRMASATPQRNQRQFNARDRSISPQAAARAEQHG